MKKRILSLTIALFLLISMAACGQSGETPSESPQQSESQAPAASEPPPSDAEPSASEPVSEAPAEQPGEATADTPAEPIVYEMPLTDTMVEFSFWIEAGPPFVTPTLGSEQSYNTSEASLYLKNLSNINIKFTEVDMFSKSEKFNLMVVSGSYPDMINGFRGLYSGGAEQALDDEVIIEVTDLINSQMPAYRQILDENPIYEKELLNDDSQILFISGFNDEVYGTDGPAIRKDWLDALSLEVPKTYDQLYEAGKAFLTEYDSQMAIYLTASVNPGVSLSGGFGLPAFGIDSAGSHFYQKDGKVTSAYIEDDFKDMLKMLKQWYADGLIDKDFYTAESGQYAESTVFSDNTGVFYGPANFITQYNESLKDTGFYAVGMPLIRMEEDQIIHFNSAMSSLHTINDLCIASTCENLDILAKWLDFHFTEAGQLLNNYGLEGKSYELDAEGNPQYYPELYSTPGTNFMQNASNYIYNSAPSLFVADRVDKVSFDEVANEAVEMYNTGTDGAWELPANLYSTQEENDAYYAKIGDIETYTSSEIVKFIIGDNDIDSGWDAYVSQIMTLGLQQCIDAKQAAYNRYLSR